MAKDPQQLRKAYEYKLGKDLVDQLSDDQISKLSKYYNSLTPDQQSNVDSELVKGKGEFLNTARSMADPLKYPSDRSVLPQQEKVPAGLDDLLKDIREEKVPKGLDDLLKNIRSDTPKSGGALAVIPKPSPSQQRLVGDEKVDPEILKALGIGDVTDLDYGEYQSLLREKMMANQMGSGGDIDQDKLKNEFKRVRGKTGSFKVKSQPKITPSSFVARTRANTDVRRVTPLLPESTVEERTATVPTERVGIDKTLKLLSAQLQNVDDNVQSTVKNINKKDQLDEKEKEERRRDIQNEQAKQREDRRERSSSLIKVPALVSSVVSPIKGVLDKFFDFLKKIAFGMFVVELFKFLKDPKGYLNGVIVFFNEQIGKLETALEDIFIDNIMPPINNMIKIANGAISNVINFINPLLGALSFIPGVDKIDASKLQIPELTGQSVRGGFNLPKIPTLTVGEEESSTTPQTDRPDRDERSSEPTFGTEGINPRTGRPYSETPGKSEVEPEGPTFGRRGINPRTGLPYDESPGKSPTRPRPQEPTFGRRGINPRTGRPYSESPGKSSSRPQEPLMGPQSRGGLTPEQKAFAETVSFAEGTAGEAGYNTWFGGSEYAGDLSRYTINEVVDLQRKFLREGRGRFGNGQQSAAVGKYQMIEPELYAAAAGLDPAVDKFSPENQDKLFLFGYIMKQAGVTEAEINSPTLSDETIDKLSPVFASFPNLFGPGQGGKAPGDGVSFYPNQGAKMKGDLKERFEMEREKRMRQSSMVTAPMSQQVARTSPTVNVPAPPVMMASMTTIGGNLSLPNVSTPSSVASASQTEVQVFSASDPSNLSVIAAKSVYGVVT